MSDEALTPDDDADESGPADPAALSAEDAAADKGEPPETSAESGAVDSATAEAEAAEDFGAEASAPPATRPESTIRTAVREAPGGREIPKVEIPDTPLRVAPGLTDDRERHIQRPTADTNVILWGFLVIVGGGLVFVLLYVLQIAAILPGLVGKNGKTEQGQELRESAPNEQAP